MKTKQRINQCSNERIIEMTYDPIEFTNSKQFLENVLRITADKISDELIKNHLPEILEKISVEALANMTIAQAGAEINRTLKEKIPDKIFNIETEKTVVYQRGIFGGLKRVK